jgi:hypothetical protein
MRDFVDTLPLRLAAVVAALVGIICLWNRVELWTSAGRIGITFGVLLLAGLVVRRLLLPLFEGAMEHPAARNADGAAPGAAPGAPTTSGRNVDLIAPGTPIADLLRDEHAEEE